MEKNKYSIYLGLMVLLVILVGIGAAFFLTRQPQDVRQQASVKGGTVQIAIRPTTTSLAAGANTSLTVSLNPGGKTISGVAARIKYQFAGDQPELTASNITPLITNAGGGWSCPIKQVQTNGNTVSIDFSCIHTGVDGFTSGSSINLFSFTLNAINSAKAQEYTLVFDPTATVVTNKATGQDIAAIPQSLATVTVTGATADPTAEPTTSLSPTTAVTASPTGSSFNNIDDSSLACDATCTASRQCANDFICYNGQCRSDQCQSDNTCGCVLKKVATDSNLPTAGGTDPTYLMVLTGLLFLVGGGSLMVHTLLKNSDDGTL